jgi:hypothetical protein
MSWLVPRRPLKTFLMVGIRIKDERRRRCMRPGRLRGKVFALSGSAVMKEPEWLSGTPPNEDEAADVHAVLTRRGVTGGRR